MFASYRTENSLIQHERLCNDHDFCEAIIPTEGQNILKYRHDKKSIPMPHLIYADLECILKKIESCQPDPDKSYTLKKNVHTPSGYAVHLVRSYDQKLTTHYRGEDCMQKFVQAIEILSKMITATSRKKLIPLTSKEEYIFNRSKCCLVCKKPFFEEENKERYKVKDHCFYTDKYRGPAHSKCCEDIQSEKEIPVVFLSELNKQTCTK